ncbi:Probable Sec-independent protein translocase protein TatB homolog [Mycobacteroides abscessus]|nr:Probable Sec-independent protein translocase protein TatB homolog [Mycobacteroides abscessus]
MTPRAVITKHLLDGDDSVFDSLTRPLDDVKKAVTEPAPTPIVNPELAKPAEPGPTRYDADAT